MAEHLKKERSSAKGNVTNSLRKLKAALNRGDEIVELKSLAQNLESAFDKLSCVHLDYVDCTQEDEGYLDQITREFDEVLVTYHRSLKALDQIEKEKIASPLRREIERGIVEMNTIMRDIKETLNSESSPSADVLSLQLDKEQLQKLVYLMFKNLGDLEKLIDTTELYTNAEEVSTKCNKVMREVSLYLRRHQSGLQSSSRLESSTDTIVSSPEIVVSTPSSMPSTPETLIYSQNPDVQVSMTPTGTQYQLSPLSDTFIPSNSVCSERLDRSLSNTVNSQNVISAYQPIGSSGQTTFHPRMTYTFANTQASSANRALPISSSMGNIQSFQPLSTFLPNSIANSTIQSFQPSTLFPNNGYGSTIQTKKPALPTFSGDRADWPEFKCVWRSLAEAQFSNSLQLAMELKRCCRGKAAERIKHIYVTTDRAYGDMWERLTEEYDDPGLSVQSALSRLMSIKTVDDKDYAGIVKFVDDVEGIHSQLRELNQVDAVHMVDVDRISLRLPKEMHMGWLRKYRELSPSDKLKPFGEFVTYLKGERSVVARLVEWTQKPKGKEKYVPDRKVMSHNTESKQSQGRLTSSSKGKQGQLKYGDSGCVVHGKGHKTKDCRSFLKMSVSERYDALKKARSCFKCFRKHNRAQCSARPCNECGREHNLLLCSKSSKEQTEKSPETFTTSTKDEVSEERVDDASSNLANRGCKALYPVNEVNVVGCTIPVTVFLDAGSDASYVTESCASKLHLKKIRKVSLKVSVVGGGTRDYKSAVYEVPIRTSNSKIVKVLAYGLEVITGPLEKLDRKVIQALFPQYDVDFLMRKSNTVDLLIGTDYYGLHPKKEIANAGKNLSIMDGELGPCLVGTHPDIKENTRLCKDTPRQLKGSCARSTSKTHHASHHAAFNPPNTFFFGEEKATEVTSFGHIGLNFLLPR